MAVLEDPGLTFPHSHTRYAATYAAATFSEKSLRTVRATPSHQADNRKPTAKRPGEAEHNPESQGFGALNLCSPWAGM